MAMQQQSNHAKQASNTILQINQSNKVLIFSFDDALFPTTKLKEISGRNKDAHKYIPEYKEANEFLGLQMTSQEVSELSNMSYITYKLLLQCIEEYSKQNICIVSISGPNWIKEALTDVYEIGFYSDIYRLLFIPDENETINDMISIYQPSVNEHKLMNYSKNFAVHAAFWTHDTFKQIINKKVEIIGDEISHKFEIISNISWEYKAAEKLKESVGSLFGSSERVDITINKLNVEPTIEKLARRQQTLFQVAPLIKMNQNASEIARKIVDSLFLGE